MSKLRDIGRHRNEVLTNIGRGGGPCPVCGCSVFAILTGGEVVCGECGPPGRQARRSEVARWGIVVVEPDGRHALADLEAEQQAAREARERRDDIDLSPRGHGRWRRVPGGWRRVA